MLEDGLAALLGRAAAGDRAAFAALYRQSAAQLFALAVRLLHERGLAEDALEEAYLRIWRNAASFAPARGSALTWMASFVRKAAFDRLCRERGGHRRVVRATRLALPGPVPGSLDGMLRQRGARALLRGLGALEAEPREAILRAYFQGLSHADLAAAKGTTLGKAKSLIRRGLMQLKEFLGA